MLCCGINLPLLFCDLSDFIICIPQNLEGMYVKIEMQTCSFAKNKDFKQL